MYCKVISLQLIKINEKKKKKDKVLELIISADTETIGSINKLVCL